MNPPSLGCAIGILDYSNFVYHPISNAPLASDIFLTPTGQGFEFTQTTGTPFVASAGHVVQFEIDYNIFIDPAPIVFGSKTSLDPPTGNVSVTQFFCNDSAYVFEGACSGAAPQKLSVGTPITGYPYSSSITFTPPAFKTQAVAILFTLNGTKGVSSFDGLSTDTIVMSASPEPAYAAAIALFLLAFGGYRIRKQYRTA